MFGGRATGEGHCGSERTEPQRLACDVIERTVTPSVRLSTSKPMHRVLIIANLSLQLNPRKYMEDASVSAMSMVEVGDSADCWCGDP